MRKLKKYTPTKFMAEDSHYDKDAAAHIRAIVTNSYPYVSLADMRTNLATAGFEEAADQWRLV